ncbi:hypothetical protein JB92DRAFT_1159636 [Gautieria morchelliformis]|nr:hypothetical protein JB92DRAFT_1159636 [Gautieria morchelliformis]
MVRSAPFHGQCHELGTNNLLSLCAAIHSPYVAAVPMREVSVPSSSLSQTSMASITGHCPVCRELFNAEARRPHCIPCGHLFCLDCLTRMCGRTCGLCPFCRTAFHAEDIRWLFFSYELDTSSHERHYTSSDSVNCPTVLEWLYDARDDLEKKLFEVVNNRNCPTEVLSELQAEITAWLSAYEATMLPPVPENKPLEVAAETLAITCRRAEQMEKLRAQLAAKRRDVMILQKNVAETAIARQDAELKVKEYVSNVSAIPRRS